MIFIVDKLFFMEIYKNVKKLVIISMEGDEKINQKVGQEQIHGLIFSDKLSWQSIIYDLINSEQLDPWDIDLSLLSNKFLERVRELEEANFFVSSKVLLAASLLLRIKSEILLNHDIRSLDDILFGKKEEKKYVQERIDLDDEIPELVVKTPLPRYKRVTLDELMKALNHAIKTETRRIKRIVVARQQEFETAIALPKRNVNMKDKINEIFYKLEDIFKDKKDRLAFSDIAGETNEDKILTFVPLLHLDNQHKIWLEQDGHFEEIWIMLKKIYMEQNKEMFERMRKEVEEEIEMMSQESINVKSKGRGKKKKIVSNDFSNPIDEVIEEEILNEENEEGKENDVSDESD